MLLKIMLVLCFVCNIQPGCISCWRFFFGRHFQEVGTSQNTQSSVETNSNLDNSSYTLRRHSLERTAQRLSPLQRKSLDITEEGSPKPLSRSGSSSGSSEGSLSKWLPRCLQDGTMPTQQGTEQKDDFLQRIAKNPE